jgi:hypothetical protein
MEGYVRPLRMWGLLSALCVGPMLWLVQGVTSMMSRIRCCRAVSTAASMTLGSVGFDRGLGMVLPPLPGIMHDPRARRRRIALARSTLRRQRELLKENSVDQSPQTGAVPLVNRAPNHVLAAREAGRFPLALSRVTQIGEQAVAGRSSKPRW